MEDKAAEPEVKTELETEKVTTTEKNPETKAPEEKVPESKEPEKKVEEKPAENAEEKKDEGKEPEKKPDEKKPEEKKPESKAPEKYELKLPKDTLLKPTVVERIAAEAKAQGLTNEQAQALLEREDRAVKEFRGEQQVFLDTKKVEWKEASSTDEEIGGENFARNSELAARVVNRFGTDALKREMDQTGYGNHPELVRLLVRIGHSMSEDQLVLPGAQPGGPKKTRAQKFYGDPPKKTDN